MRHFVVAPEIAGYLGPSTEFDRTVVPPRVTYPHYVVETWLGDLILEAHPVFLIESHLGDAVVKAGMSGLSLADALVTRSDQSVDLDPDLDLPSFRWLRLGGRVSVDDFAGDDLDRLVVSERALSALRDAGMRHATVAAL